MAVDLEGRGDRFAAALRLLPLSDRCELLKALDEITRPLSEREVERALLEGGLSRTEAKRTVWALKAANLIVLGGAINRQ